MIASVTFVAGTPPERVEAFVNEMENALYETDEEFGAELVRVANVATGRGYFSNGRKAQTGDQFASVTVELIPVGSSATFATRRLSMPGSRVCGQPPGLEYLTITSRTGGHPGRDLEVRLTGSDIDALKAGALELSDALGAIPGIKAVEDDMPFGQQQLVFRLSPFGESLWGCRSRPLVASCAGLSMASLRRSSMRVMTRSRSASCYPMWSDTGSPRWKISICFCQRGRPSR